ncbi:hypothetical protein CYMTET_19953 [Cymbomonas tetramitiformis]|uniref:Uncharacterized protein n=1 Tax=Cymbomonas tetramitiformis TaxID=36881 RepID=A0AAE0G6B3_9CHLO|nr:hypothetical protein CYMTET_19953 [Cymbomonas tetramitiformis]
MLAVRVLKNFVNPHDAIANFNAALTAARRRSTIDEEAVNSQFIKAFEVESGDPPVAEPCTAAADLVEIVLVLKRQVKAPADTTYVQAVEAQMGFSVGGVGTEHGVHMDAFAAHVTASPTGRHRHFWTSRNATAIAFVFRPPNSGPHTVVCRK